MKILCYGSLNLDHVYTVDHFIREGETQTSLRYQTFCGGKGLNQSVALARAGVSAWQGGAVGSSDSKPLLDLLHDCQVDTHCIRHRDVATGHAIIQRLPTGENAILVEPGANRTLKEADIEADLSQLSPGDYLLLQNETNALSHLIEAGHRRNLGVFLNPSPFDAHLKSIPWDYLSGLILNEVESLELLKFRGVSQKFDPTQNGEGILRALNALFPNTCIVVTLGRQGAYAFDPKESSEVYYEPIFQVPVVDTTGAGDCFTGYFLAARMQGDDLQKALWKATGAAALSVTKSGASSSIPTQSELASFLKDPAHSGRGEPCTLLP